MMLFVGWLCIAVGFVNVYREGTSAYMPSGPGHEKARATAGSWSADLSRAFDQLPRSSLEASMAHAGIPPELRHAILAVHESCSYRVSHGPHSRTFAMARGVRQGCALSPLLYSIYSAWLYDQLVEGTSEEWASRLATLFADDSHIAFEIESQEDLGFALRAVRKLFELFGTTGMCVNPGKSSVVLSLKGSAAKRWIRQHTCTVDGKHAIQASRCLCPRLIVWCI